MAKKIKDKTPREEAERAEDQLDDAIEDVLEGSGMWSDCEEMLKELKTLEKMFRHGHDEEESAGSVIGLVPGFAMAQEYLTTAHAQGLLAVNSVQEQKLASLLGLTTTYKCVKSMLSVSEQTTLERIEEGVDRIVDDLENRDGDVSPPQY